MYGLMMSLIEFSSDPPASGGIDIPTPRQMGETIESNPSGPSPVFDKEYYCFYDSVIHIILYYSVGLNVVRCRSTALNPKRPLDHRGEHFL
jgi:hypothetical protein